LFREGLLEKGVARDGGGLPEGFAAGQAEGGEGADVSQRLQLGIAQLGTDGDVVDRREGRGSAGGFDALAGVFAQTGVVTEAETERQAVSRCQNALLTRMRSTEPSFCRCKKVLNRLNGCKVISDGTA
jgi:hypothetical protein